MNWHFFKAISETPSINRDYVIGSILNIITRFSVPAFVMISGAFNLNNEKNGNFSFFYKRTSWKIFIPLIGAMWIIFTIDIFRAMILGRNIAECVEVSVKGMLVGSYHNLWFMYMLAGLYFFTPFLIKLKAVISKRCYIRLALIMMIWSIGSQALSSQRAAYTIGVVVAFLAYYMVGDIVQNYLKLRHRASFYFSWAGMMFLCTFFARYAGVKYYLSNAYTNFFSPFIVISSICVLAGFEKMAVKRDMSWLAGKTFYIYVFHSIVYTAVLELLTVAFGENYIFFQLTIVVVMTFFVSLVIAVVYDLFWKTKKSWKEHWYNLKIWNC